MVKQECPSKIQLVVRQKTYSCVKIQATRRMKFRLFHAFFSRALCQNSKAPKKLIGFFINRKIDFLKPIFSILFQTFRKPLMYCFQIISDQFFAGIYDLKCKQIIFCCRYLNILSCALCWVLFASIFRVLHRFDCLLSDSEFEF